MDLDYHVVGHVKDTVYLEVSGIEEPETSGPPAEVLDQIAHDILGLETLETRGSDGLDFHDMSVELIRSALAAAYEAGRTTKEPREGP